jgi:hypothetical protein
LIALAAAAPYPRTARSRGRIIRTFSQSEFEDIAARTGGLPRHHDTAPTNIHRAPQNQPAAIPI